MSAYADGPWPLPWSRLEDFVRIPNRDPRITIELKSLLKDRVRDGDEKARQLLGALELRRP